MKPHFADCAEECMQFAEEWSGGKGSPAILELEQYAKTLNGRREPEKGQLGLLAGAKLARAPKWPVACLKVILSAPDSHVPKNNEAKVFVGADITLMEKKHMPRILEACALMEKAREWFGADQIKSPACTTKLIGEMDTRLVEFVAG